MKDKKYLDNPEPVPPATQLAVLPFLAAVDGFLRESRNPPGLRLTVHRTFTRNGETYLQQVCAYLQDRRGQWKQQDKDGVLKVLVGRTFEANFGIIGKAFDGKIWRTKRLATVAALEKSLRDDGQDPKKVVKSWLAIPFLGPPDVADGKDKVVLILFADCDEFNFFADDERVRHLVAMCDGFCRLFDWLQDEPFENLRNHPLEEGTPVTGDRVAFNVQEPLTGVAPPRFRAIRSFNYEAASP